MSHDAPIAWSDWYAFVIADLRIVMADERMHPAARATCREYLGHLSDAADRSDHDECMRLDALIRERVETELLWFAQSATGLEM